MVMGSSSNEATFVLTHLTDARCGACVLVQLQAAARASWCLKRD